MRVALDLEDVLVENVRNFLGELNSYIESHRSTERRFKASDLEGWKFKGLREDFAEMQGWNSDITEKFMFGDGKEWEGFYPITERMWRENPSSFSKTEKNIAVKVRELNKTVEAREGSVSILTARENVRTYVETRIKQLGIKDFVEDVLVEWKKQRLDFDIYIDDHPWLHRRIAGKRQLMYDQPWNRREKLGDSHRRIKNISEAVEVIQDLD